ncbi:hypothetical protein BGZ97_002744 [Linnemannia gamsii]|uniref:HCP-like protein n=1 Tax=Linnemannia gamsii TaxID=64522 RepID=A0A9P6QWP6_9FUNG|nr:hypothetical protein BGZ97_002744 [Linnemannia gamsii]
MPNIVLDVVVGGPSVNKEGSSLQNGVLRRPEPMLQQGDDKKDRNNTEFQDIVPTSPSSPSRRNPVYGLEETAMDNYSHIDKPLAFPSARGPQAALDDQKTAVSNPAISSQQDNDAKRSTPGPQSITTKHIKEMDLVETSISGYCGNKEAQVAIGDMYRDAEGVPLDYQRAMDWYLQAAERGDPVAQTRIGMLYYYGRPAPKDYAKSMEWCLKAAEEGHANAQTHIGDLYNRGEGVIQSYAQAMEWYLKAAHQGHMIALGRVGELYEYGRGLPQSYAKAVEWYQKATEQGHGGARNRLEELKKMGVVVH